MIHIEEVTLKSLPGSQEFGKVGKFAANSGNKANDKDTDKGPSNKRKATDKAFEKKLRNTRKKTKNPKNFRAIDNNFLR